MTVAYILHSTSQAEGSVKSFLVMLEGLMGMGVKPVVIVPDKTDIYEKLKAITQ